MKNSRRPPIGNRATTRPRESGCAGCDPEPWFFLNPVPPGSPRAGGLSAGRGHRGRLSSLSSVASTLRNPSLRLSRPFGGTSVSPRGHIESDRTSEVPLDLPGNARAIGGKDDQAFISVFVGQGHDALAVGKPAPESETGFRNRPVSQRRTFPEAHREQAAPVHRRHGVSSRVAGRNFQ